VGSMLVGFLVYLKKLISSMGQSDVVVYCALQQKHNNKMLVLQILQKKEGDYFGKCPKIY
jgi:hypothetical protein